jgi:hypothetical protein
VGEAGHISAKFRRLLDAGNFELARLLAFELPRVGLDDALKLTLLAAELESAHFQPMGRRWLARLADEVRPDLRDLAVAAQFLADVARAKTPSASSDGTILKGAGLSPQSQRRCPSRTSPAHCTPFLRSA